MRIGVTSSGSSLSLYNWRRGNTRSTRCRSVGRRNDWWLPTLWWSIHRAGCYIVFQPSYCRRLMDF